MMAEKKLKVGVEWEDYTAVHFGNKPASSLRLLKKNRELAVVGPSARGFHLDPKYKQGVWAEGHLIQGQAGPFKNIAEAKTYVERVFGATEDCIQHLEEELAVYKVALNYAVRHILTGAGMSKERAQGILQEEVEAYIRLGKEHLLSFVKANAKR